MTTRFEAFGIVVSDMARSLPRSRREIRLLADPRVPYLAIARAIGRSHEATKPAESFSSNGIVDIRAKGSEPASQPPERHAQVVKRIGRIGVESFQRIDTGIQSRAGNDAGRLRRRLYEQRSREKCPVRCRH